MSESFEGSTSADQLIVTREGAVIQTLTLTMDTLTIGRFPDNGLVLPDQRVSRDHALLRREGDTFVVVDKSSTGTLVNGKRVSKDEPYRLAPSDEIQLGPFVLTYKAQPTVVRRVRSDMPTVPQIQVLDRRHQIVQVAEIQEQQSLVTGYSGTPGHQELQVAETRTKGSCRIGRGRSSDLVLNSRYVSREQLRADWDGRSVTVTDLSSSNGTWRQGSQLPKGQPVAWAWGETLRVGPFYLRLDRVRRTDRIDVSLDRQALTLKPTQPDVLKVTLTNLGDTVDHLTVLVDGAGVQKDWWAGPEMEVQLNPRVRTTVPVTVTVPNKPDARAGEYHVQVRARSRENPAESGFADGSWTVLPFTEDALQLSPGRVAGRLKGDYDVVLHNGGNTPVTYTLGASDDEKALKYDFKADSAEAETVEIGPGETARLALQVRPPLRLTGPQQQRTFLVQALPRGADKPRQAAVVFSQMALIPAWLLWLLTTALPILLIAAFAYLFALPPDPALAIDGNRTQINEGQTIDLKWQAMRGSSAYIMQTITSADKRQRTETTPVELFGPNQPVVGQKANTIQLAPREDTDYTLVVKNILGMESSSRIAKVAVIPKPGTPQPHLTTANLEIASEKESVTLNWSNQDTTSMTIKQGWGDQKIVYPSATCTAQEAKAGTCLVPPPDVNQKTYTYVLTARNDADPSLRQVDALVTVRVKPPTTPPVLAAASGTLQVYEGAEVVLGLTAPAGATSMKLTATSGEIEKGKAGPVDVTGKSQYAVYPTKTSDYQLIAENAGGESPPATLKVQVRAMQIKAFGPETQSVTKGLPATLTWQVEAAPTADIIASIEPDVGPVGLTGSMPVTPSKVGTQQYTLKVRYSDGTVAQDANKKALERSVKIVVNQGPVEATLTAIGQVKENESTTLSIEAKGATHVKVQQMSADKPSGPVIFEEDANPQGYAKSVSSAPLKESAIFRLTATNASGQDTADVTVIVNELAPTPVPPPAGGADSSGAAPPVTGILRLPYVTQNDGSPLANSNCGPASLSMALRAFGRTATSPEIRVDVDSVDKGTDPSRGSSWWALSSAARKRDLLSHGLDRRWSVGAINGQSLPLIILTRYALLPNHRGSSSTSDHYIVLLGTDSQGNFWYHDPWRNGSYKSMTRAQLDLAWGEATPPYTAMYLSGR